MGCEGLKAFRVIYCCENYGKRKHCKKRILIVSRDSEYLDVVKSLNKTLKNYCLESLPSVLNPIEEIVELQLRKGDYDGFLVDELYVEFLPKTKQQEKKYGVIRWGNCYDDETKKIMSENKIVKFGAETPTNIEKELDAIFA